MFDINKTIKLIQDALLNANATWDSYKEENHSLQETAMILTIPLILASTILTAIFGYIFSSYTMFGSQTGIVSMLLSLVMALVGIVLASYIFSFLAGVFNGKNDFARGFAALSLTAVPAYLGSILGTLPLIGVLLSLGLSIYSLVLLYKIIPSYLEVPQEKRVIHFIASLLASFVLMVIIAMVLGAGSAASSISDGSSTTTTPTTTQNNGMFGGIERQANILQAAGNDKFTAPTDGKISESQMQTLIQTLQKTKEYREAQQAKITKFEEEANKKEFSFSDLGKMAAGMGSIMSVSNAEMEVVKTSGRNWAEHSWVKNQLQTAAIQKDISEAVKHNYALYQKYEQKLNEFGL